MLPDDPPPPVPRLNRIIALAACLVAAASSAFGAAITWNGSADDLWSNSANWTGGTPALNDIYFNNTGASATAGVVTSIVDQSYTVSSLSFSNTQYQNLQLQAGANLSVSGGISVGGSSVSSSVTLVGSDSSFITTSGTYINNGILNVNDGTSLSISGSLAIGYSDVSRINSTGTLNLAPGAALHLGTLTTPSSLSLAQNYGYWNSVTAAFAPDSAKNPDMVLYLSSVNLGTAYNVSRNGGAGSASGTVDLTNYTGPLGIQTLNIGGSNGTGHFVFGNAVNNILSFPSLSINNGDITLNAGATLAITGGLTLGEAENPGSYNAGSNNTGALNLAPGAALHIGTATTPSSLNLAQNYWYWNTVTATFAPDSSKNPDIALYLSSVNLGTGYNSANNGGVGSASGTLNLTNYTGPLSIQNINIGGSNGTGHFIFGNAVNNLLSLPSISINHGDFAVNSGSTLTITGSLTIGATDSPGKNNSGGDRTGILNLASGAALYLGTPTTPSSLSLAQNYLYWNTVTGSFAPDSSKNPDMAFYLSSVNLGTGYNTANNGAVGSASGTLDFTNYTGPLSIQGINIGGANGTGHFIFGNTANNRLSVPSVIVTKGDLTINQRSTLAVTSAITISSNGSLAVHVGGVAGGLSVENASNSALSLAAGANRMVIDFDDPDVRTPNYYGLRWKGDHVSQLQAKLNQYGYTGDGGIKIVANGAFVRNATLQLGLMTDGGITYTYLGFNAEPNTQIPLAGATPLDPAYLTGTASLPSPNTSVWSLELRQGSQLNMFAGDHLTALGGVMVDADAVLNAAGIIGGDVRNSGGMALGSASVVGTCNLLNNFTQAASGGLLFKLGGNEQGISYDYLHITGTATIEGLITATLINGFQPVNHSKFDVMTADAGIVWGGGGVAFTLPPGFTWALVDGNKTLQLSYDVYSEIAVEQPAGQDLTAGSASIPYDALAIGTHSIRTFTIRNTGGVALDIPSITTIGANADDFTVNTTGMNAPVAPGGSTTFTVTFAPTGNTSSPRTATLRIANDDPDENPFDIALTSQAFSTTADLDGDGLNDWEEYRNASLGFDWQTAQPALVNVFVAGANSANLYTPAQYADNRTAGRNDVLTSPNTYDLYTTTQVQAMNVDAPLIERDPATGEFILTIGLEKSTDLENYSPFPVTMPQATITPQGKLRLRFSVPDNAAFFRVEAR
jgi:hypothetical protein